MQALESLDSIAEISVTLIGFSGLIFVFRARDVTELEARDLAALAQILASGGISLAFSLLPLPLAYVDLPEAVRWQLMTGSLALAMALAAGIFWQVNRRLTRDGHPERTPGFNRATFGTLLLLAGLLAGAACEALPAVPVYLFALVVCVILCLVFVVLMLVIARRLGSGSRRAAPGKREEIERP